MKPGRCAKFFISVALPAGIACTATAAPDEELLGKAEGYPLCKFGDTYPRCLVAQYSNFDKLVPSRKIAAGGAPSALNQTPAADRSDFEDYLARNRNTGLLVLKDGAVLFEGYQYDRTPQQRFASQSMAKTVVAMPAGIALRDKALGSLDDPAEKYVPRLKGHPYGETSLRNLITMSSGVKFSERYDGRDDMAVLVSRTLFQTGPGGADTVLPFRERARPAGEAFAYASAETQVLGLVLRAAVGKPLADYLSEKIWRPMGAEADATWLVDAGGQEIAYCCINATLRDWGRLGALLANGGSLNGTQIIPADWLREATMPSAPHLQHGKVTPTLGYGYQTWLLPKGRFALFGVRGQGIYIDPETKLVVVHTAVHAMPRDTEARRAQVELWGKVLAKYAR
jgi:CubicO group peptidase (beta-lactamase class C family)